MSCKTSVAWSPSVATDSCLSVSPSVVWTSAVSLVPGLIVMSSWVTVHLGGWFPCLPVSVVRLILFLFLDFHHSTLADPYHFLGFDNFLCFRPPQLFVCRRNDPFFKVWHHKKKLLEQLSSCFITLCHISMFFFSLTFTVCNIYCYSFVIWYLFYFSYIGEMAYRNFKYPL